MRAAVVRWQILRHYTVASRAPLSMATTVSLKTGLSIPNLRVPQQPPITLALTSPAVGDLGGRHVRQSRAVSARETATSGSTHPFFSARAGQQVQLAGVSRSRARNSHLHRRGPGINTRTRPVQELTIREKVTTQLRS